MRTVARPLRVLIVDGCPDTTSSCADLLGLYGFEARTAGSGGDALALIDAWWPDVVMTELRLPGADGFEAARRIRGRERDGRTVRLVAVTGLATPGYRAAAWGAGFDHYLVKPADPGVMLGLLRGCAAALSRRPPRPIVAMSS